MPYANSESVLALECYGTSYNSTFKTLYVKGMKETLKETFDFVPAEPEISTFNATEE